MSDIDEALDWPGISDALASEIRNAWSDFQAENALHPCEPPPSFIEGYRRAIQRPRTPGISLDEACNIVCRDIPDGCYIDLCMENGAAYVTLERDGHYARLPDSADKTLWEQLQDALAAAPNPMPKGDIGKALKETNAGMRGPEADQCPRCGETIEGEPDGCRDWDCPMRG